MIVNDSIKRVIMDLKKNQHLSYTKIVEELQRDYDIKISRQRVCDIYNEEVSDFVIRLSALGHSKASVIKMSVVEGITGLTYERINNIIEANNKLFNRIVHEYENILIEQTMACDFTGYDISYMDYEITDRALKSYLVNIYKRCKEISTGKIIERFKTAKDFSVSDLDE